MHCDQIIILVVNNSHFLSIQLYLMCVCVCMNIMYGSSSIYRYVPLLTNVLFFWYVLYMQRGKKGVWNYLAVMTLVLNEWGVGVRDLWEEGARNVRRVTVTVSLLPLVSWCVCHHLWHLLFGSSRACLAHSPVMPGCHAQTGYWLSFICK